jgi:hypothetical protein
MSPARLAAYWLCLFLLIFPDAGFPEARKQKTMHAAGQWSAKPSSRPAEPLKLRLSLRISEAKRDEKKSRLYRSLSRRQRIVLIGRP